MSAATIDAMPSPSLPLVLMQTLNAKDLSILDVEKQLQFQEVLPFGRYSDFFQLTELTEEEHKDILQITTDFRHYLKAGKVSEGLIKALVVFPMLRLAGFYRHPIELKVEENIAPIVVEDGDRVMKGRYDILAINADAGTDNVPLWILIAEAKNSAIAYDAGLAQLLAYAHSSLTQQQSVWGLVTNGQNAQFVLMYKESTPQYQLFPPLYLREFSQAEQLGQILKTLCQLKVATPKPAVV